MKTLKEGQRCFKIDEDEVHHVENIHTSQEGGQPIITNENCSKEQECTFTVHCILLDLRNYIEVYESVAMTQKTINI
jgi:hypothetical protein